MDINHILKCWVSSGERNMTEREWVKRRLMGYQRDDQSSLWDLLWIHWQSQRRLKRGSREVLYLFDCHRQTPKNIITSQLAV